MKNKILSRIAIIFTALSVAAFAACIAPGFLTIFLAIAAFLVAIFGLLVFIIGGFVGLCAWAGDGGTILHGATALGVSSFNVSGAIFTVVPPVAEFCFIDFSPICAYIGIGFGAIALIFAVFALVTAKSKVSKELKPEELSSREEEGQDGQKFRYDEEAGEWKENTQRQAVSGSAAEKDKKDKKRNKPRKPKKQRTDRGVAILWLVLSVVFTALNVLALLAVNFLANNLF